jgi:hypothetical protein
MTATIRGTRRRNPEAAGVLAATGAWAAGILGAEADTAAGGWAVGRE